MAVFASRQIVMPVLPIAVTITGKGKANYCYATINGTNQYEAGTHEVYSGDTITFGVFGSGRDYGLVKIDGTKVLESTTHQIRTYDWTVPNGISTIEIAMESGRAGSRDWYGRITVTTA